MTKCELPRTIWLYNPPDAEYVDELSSALQIPNFVGSVLIQRGYRDYETAKSFLNPSVDALYDPYLLNDMDRAIERIVMALRRQEKILVCGDYDVDGITSAALLKKCLPLLGLEVFTFLPNRLLDGYGFHFNAIDYAQQIGASLIITVDCGITSREAVEAACALKIDVIITDHHEPNGLLPNAYAIINPKRVDSTYPDQNLAGIGVTFKLLQAMIQSGMLEFPLIPLLEFVALGTVADVAQLTGENRIFVHQGLEALTHTTHPGLRALMKIAGVTPGKKLDPVTIGFQIGPRINAVGRLGSPDQALNLLLTESPEIAQHIASELNRLNQQRQNIEEAILLSAEAQINVMNFKDDPFFVISGERWHEGVIGIVASKIADKYYRPACIISIKDSIGKGSGRSIPSFSLFDCLCEVNDCLIEFGGHQIAAGFRIKEENIEEFRRRCNQIARKKIKPEDSIPKTSVDYVMSFSELSYDAIRYIETLAPFGLGNPKPRYLFKNLRLKFNPKVVGNDGQHLKLVFTDGHKSVDGIAFGFGRFSHIVESCSNLDVVATPEINFWNNREIIQLNVHDMKPLISR